MSRRHPFAPFSLLHNARGCRRRKDKLMTEITPILPVRIVSNYTRTYPVGDTLTTVHVKHTQTGDGPVRVSEVSYTTYNNRGQSVEPLKPMGQNVDISA